jgi:hypothetical protein
MRAVLEEPRGKALDWRPRRIYQGELRRRVSLFLRAKTAERRGGMGLPGASSDSKRGIWKRDIALFGVTLRVT